MLGALCLGSVTHKLTNYTTVMVPFIKLSINQKKKLSIESDILWPDATNNGLFYVFDLAIFFVKFNY